MENNFTLIQGMEKGGNRKEIYQDFTQYKGRMTCLLV